VANLLPGFGVRQSEPVTLRDQIVEARRAPVRSDGQCQAYASHEKNRVGDGVLVALELAIGVQVGQGRGTQVPIEFAADSPGIVVLLAGARIGVIALEKIAVGADIDGIQRIAQFEDTGSAMRVLCC